MKLYYAPGACSIGIHLLLQEIGRPFEIEAVNLREGAQYQPAFRAINPKSKVPTLVRDDGSVLTEFAAIAYYLARSNPQAELFPEDLETQTQVLSILDFAVSTLHMQGFSRLFRPGNFSPSESDAQAVKTRGAEIFNKGIALVDQALAGHEYVAGRFSIADAALFYVERWASRMPDVLPLPANAAAHLARVTARPAAQAVLQAEGLAG